MSSVRSARFYSVVTAFALTLVFFLYQNFSEIRIDTNDYQYQVVELQHLSAKMAHSLAYGINSQGEVVGQSKGEDGFWHTVIWSQNGEIKDLGVREDFSDAKFKTPVYYAQPFSPKGVWIGPTAKEFGKRNNSCNGECKLLGELAEEVQLGYQGKQSAGFIRIRGKSTSSIEPIETGSFIFPNSVNSNTEVVGMTTRGAGGAHAFLWKKGKTYDLGSARGGVSSANDINDLGQIVGETLDESQAMKPVLWSVVDDKVSALDLTKAIERKTGKVSGRANAINNNGEVVGLLKNDRFAHPFLWTASEGIKDLNTLAKDSDPLNEERKWILEDSRGINNCGQIIGWGRKITGGAGYSVLMKPLVNKPGCS